jgi:ribosomal protein S18 acetylase RimI-like enzyme
VLTFRPMTPADLVAYTAVAVPDYANENVRTGDWAASDALERSRSEFNRLLPHGVETKDHFLRVVLDDHGTRIGEVWYFLDRSAPAPRVFLYWIGVDERHRGKGYGAEILRWLDGEAQRLGARAVLLHVFGHNTRAQELYRRTGFAVTHLQMAKTLP